MEKLENSHNFDAVNNPLKFSSLYAFQDLIDKKYNKKYFIDTSDLISIIKGIHNFIEPFRNKPFDLPLFENKMTLVHSLIYNNYLGKINLLNSHIFEFYEGLNNLKNIGLPTYQMSEMMSDIRDKLNFNDKHLYSKEINEIKKGLTFEKIKNQSLNRFKINYLINKLSVKERTIYLNKEGIINFDSDKNFFIQKHINTIFFKKAFSYLNTIDGEHQNNNFIDALALCQLNEEFNYFRSKQFSNDIPNLPIMYGRNKLIEAATKLSRDKELIVNGDKPFVLKTLNEEYLIIQNEDFFIIDALFNFSKIESVEKITFDKFYNEYIKYEFSDTIKNTARKAYHLAFFKKWWEDNGVDDLIFTLKLVNEIELEKELNEFDYVQKDFEIFYSNLKHDVKRISYGLEFINKIFNKNLYNSLYKKRDKSGFIRFDIDHEFSTRFGYNVEVIENLKNYIKSIYSSFTNENVQRNIKFDIITSLQNGLDLIYKKNGRENLVEKLMILLGILWIESEFELICDYCDSLRLKYNPSNDNNLDFYPNYHIAILHCASILSKNQTLKYEDIETIERILSCINSKCTEKSYKCMLGQAFIYSKLWEKQGMNASIPEISINISKNYNDVNKKRKFYYNIIRKLTLKCINILSENIEKFKVKDTQFIYLERLKYYSINVYIYMEVLNGDIETFKEEIGSKIEVLQSIIDPNLNHHRYLDTISRYHQRCVAHTAIYFPKNNKKFKGHLSFAISKIREALRLAKLHSNTKDIALYNALFDELKYINIEGKDYFKKKSL